jgi:hypothetical protein
MAYLLNKEQVSWIVFFSGIILLSLYFETPSIISKRPQSVHLQRQTDCASYALNYYQNKQPFFRPQVHHRFADNGYAVSEFPIVYYIAGRLYSIFGVHDYFIRLLHYLLFLVGVVYAFKISRLFIANRLLQYLPALFFFSSSFIQYYGSNFLPDVASLSLAFVGFYYYLLYRKRTLFYYFLLAALFFTFAGLLKISALILWVAILLLYFYEQFQKWRKQAFVWKDLFVWFVFSLSFMVLFAWVSFDKYYATKYHFGGNLFGLYPIWDASPHEVLSIFHRLFNEWMVVIMTWPMWCMLVLMICFVIRRHAKADAFMLHITLLSGLGCLIYSLCWFRAYYHHDYYMINVFCFPVLLMILFLSIFEKELERQNQKMQKLVYLCILLLFSYSIYDCSSALKKRYSDQKYYTINPALYEIEPYLRKIGMKRNDLVMSVPDGSTNTSLYLMNQIGWTECFNSSSYSIDYFISAGAKFLIVSDTLYTHKSPYANFCREEKKIGSYKGIYIYRIK